MIAAKRTCGWVSEDKAMSTAHAWKQCRAFGYVKNFRFCYDGADKTVYCLAHEDGIPETYYAYTTRFGEDNVVCHKVNSIVVRKNSFIEYLDMDIQIRVCFLFFFILIVFYIFPFVCVFLSLFFNYALFHKYFMLF